jgi:SAM-dependent methyltransferase
MPTPGGERSRAFWDAAAAKDHIWYVATGARDTEAFFAQGATETDFFLQLCSVPPLRPDAVVVEIGCGPGRMTRRLADLAGRVLATDVSGAMLARCREFVGDRSNVEFLQLPGDGELAGIADGSADLVFSYITLQHVPTIDAQLRYLAESVRVLRPNGRIAIQVRAAGLRAVAHDWIGHLTHFLSGRRTLSAAWRGKRLPAAAIVQTVRNAGADVVLIPHGHRHIWVAATKIAAARPERHGV